MSYRASTHYYISPRVTTYGCDLPDNGYFINDWSKESLMRFESSIRIKIIFDDASVEPPVVLKNI